MARENIAFDEHGLVPCVTQDWTHGRGADARLHEPRGARPHARDAARSTSGAAPATSCGTRARLGQRAARCARCATTATRTRCWRWSSPPARPATRASAPASTARSRRAARRAARGAAARSRARSPQRRGEMPEGSYTRRAASGGPGARSARRSRRRPRRPRAPAARSPTSGCARRRRTCSTTSACCSRRAASSYADALEELTARMNGAR